MTVDINSIEQFYEYDEEKVKLKANDMMLKSKGFILAAVNQKGELVGLDYLVDLNELEMIGFSKLMVEFINTRFGDHEEEYVEEEEEDGEYE